MFFKRHRFSGVSISLVSLLLLFSMQGSIAETTSLSQEEYDWFVSEADEPVASTIQPPLRYTAPATSQINNVRPQQPHRPNQQRFRPKPAPGQYQPVQNQNNPSSMARRLPPAVLQTLRASKVSEYGMSAFVLGIGDRQPLMVYNENTPRVPASTMKLVTTYSALGILGANYRWPTEVYMRGSLRNGTLNGDLIIKGYGAPDLETKDLIVILRNIRNKGIRNLQGRLVFDNSYFQVPRIDPGQFDGKRYETYNAQPDALLFNDRTSHFIVRPVRGKVRVLTPTPARNVKIVNRIRTVKGRCTRKNRRLGMKITQGGQGVTVTFTGRYSTRCGQREFWKAVTDPSSMLYSTMISLWKKNVGGTIRAGYANGRVPGNARLLYRHHSAPLSQIVQEVNKDSNNLRARQLLLTVGARRLGGPGSVKKGEKAIKQWLASRGMHFPELRIENGSGLSRYAHISARHIGELLLDAYRSPHRQILMQSLAVAGVDGTMKRRLRNTPVRGRGYFKTGSLRDVRAIAGYVRGVDGRVYIVSIIHNDPAARKRGRKAHDKLIEWAYWRGRPPQSIALK